MAVKIIPAEHRKADYKIDKLFLNRWSPRAMSGEAMSDEEIMPLFEAARWAPSSYNGQPWRFLYAKRDTEQWPVFFDLLVEFNQSWAKEAALLIVILSRKRFEHNDKPAITHSLDTGSAWENLALQGSLSGLVVHGMEGFDYDKARETLEVPEVYNVEAMVVVGKPGNVDDLPEASREKEVPSGRKPVSEIAFEGKLNE